MIDVEHRDGVAMVRLANGKVNAVDLELLQDIARTMRGLDDAPAVVMTGHDRAFSAGVDLGRVLDGGAAYLAAFLPALTEALLAVFDCPRPAVAAVNGHALAGGCVLALACDLRIMSGGTIGLTELPVGVPFPVAALEIVRHAAGAAADALVLTGRTVEPATALTLGLAHHVTSEADLLDEAVRRAGELAAIPPAVYASTKERLHRPTRERITRWADVDDPGVLATWSSPEAMESIRRFLDRLRARPRAVAGT